MGTETEPSASPRGEVELKGSGAAADPAFAGIKPPDALRTAPPESPVANAASGTKIVAEIVPLGTSAAGYEPGAQVAEALLEAEALLRYAATAGITLDRETTEAIARARFAHDLHAWTAEVVAVFWTALSRLTAAVKPVTAASLAADAAGLAGKSTNRYFTWTIVLGALIVPLSIIMFINTSISDEVSALVKTNDAAALTLHDELLDYQAAANVANTPAPAIIGPSQVGETTTQIIASRAPSTRDLVQKMAEFARNNRQLLARSRVLNFYILDRAVEPWWAGATLTPEMRRHLELDPRLAQTPEGGTPLLDQGFNQITTYQDIRTFAKDAQQMNLVVYGAITAYVLPIAYALLGACAFALRNLSAQTRAKAYQQSYANFARVVVSLIAGAVISVFNNFTQGVSVSPLALAFLVGYGVEVFFSFLDTLVHTFQKEKAAT